MCVKMDTSSASVGKGEKKWRKASVECKGFKITLDRVKCVSVSVCVCVFRARCKTPYTLHLYAELKLPHMDICGEDRNVCFAVKPWRTHARTHFTVEISVFLPCEMKDKCNYLLIRQVVNTPVTYS